MSLNEILKKITPLPWMCVTNDTAAHHIHNRQGKDVVLGFMNYEDATYACHAAQVLPELVEACDRVMRNAMVSNETNPLNREWVIETLRAALARAGKVGESK